MSKKERTKETRIENLRKMKKNNLDKIRKLIAINVQIDESILKLSQAPKDPLTEEEKKLQSASDKKKFSDQVQRVNLQKLDIFSK